MSTDNFLRKDDAATLILLSEAKMRNWILAAIVTNVVSLMLLLGPLVYYLGSISNQFEAVTLQSQENTNALSSRYYWIAYMEAKTQAHEDFLVEKFKFKPRNYDQKKLEGIDLK